MWFAKQTYRIFSLNRDGVRDWHSSSTNKHSKLDQSLSIPLKFLYFRYIFQIVFVSLHSQLPQILLEHFFFSDSRLECLPVWLETCSLTYILTICQLKRDSLLKKTPTIVRNGCPVRNSTHDTPKASREHSNSFKFWPHLLSSRLLTFFVRGGNFWPTPPLCERNIYTALYISITIR